MSRKPFLNEGTYESVAALGPLDLASDDIFSEIILDTWSTPESRIALVSALMLQYEAVHKNNDIEPKLPEF